jgi:formylglycine-generating enzyme required for sulfatase activity/mono/diheme cytochrome c family protein
VRTDRVLQRYGRPLVWAALAAAATGAAHGAVDFEQQIRPILEQNCVSCHGAAKVRGNLRLDSQGAALQGGKSGPAVVPGKPAESRLFRVIEMSPDEEGAMPPDGPQLPKALRDLIRAWIAEGAVWPAGVTLIDRTTVANATGAGHKLTPAELVAREHAVVDQLHARIVAQAKENAGGKAAPYEVTIPHTVVSYGMTLIPAGDFVMGTAESEAGRKPNEGPQHKVHVDAFWMQTHEVTWDEYRLFMFAQQAGEPANPDEVVDAISRPTHPYVEMSFGMGINGYPAISMTQHAANKYAEWLSAKTGEFYRLPTEAEWEYACRAGSTTAYLSGNDPAKLGDYAWYADNSNNKYQKVATKKPNAWGLFDMLGNVQEWTLDQLAPYSSSGETNPWVRSTKPYPQVTKGGSWSDSAADVRCGARVGSDPSWKQQDPQLPKSIWYHTDAQWLGFRLVRPAKIPSADEMFHYWNSGVEKD